MEKAQIIEKLKALKVGDVLVGGVGKSIFTKGKRYDIKEEDDGDLFITSDGGGAYYLRIDGTYNCSVSKLLEEGYLEFEDGHLKLPKFFDTSHIEINGYLGSCRYEITVNTDANGYERLKQLESEVKKVSEIASLERQRDEIQRKIDELKANGGLS